MPFDGPFNRRQWEQEQRELRLSRTKDARDSQESRPLAIRQGVHRALVASTITHDSPGTAGLVYFNGTIYTLALDNNSDPVIVICGGYLLNDAEEIAVDTAVFIVHLPDNTWEVLSGNCEVANWL